MIRILKNKIFHFLLFILLIGYFDGYAAEDFIVFQDDLKENLLPEDQLIIKNAIDTITQYPSGIKLFRILHNLLNQTSLKIVFRNDDYETRFEPSNIESEETLLILCYIDDKQKYESVGIQEYRISNKEGEQSNIRLVDRIKALLDEALFHEFLYMNHFLEEKADLATTNGCFQGFNASDRNLEAFALMETLKRNNNEQDAHKKSELELFPEVTEKIKGNLWQN